MIREPIPQRWQLALGASSILLLLLGYTWLSWWVHQRIPDDRTIPGWGQIIEGIVRLLTPEARTGDIWLWEDAKATLSRLAGGFGVGIAIAIVLGFLMGCWGPAEAFLQPPVKLIAKLNPVAMLAIFFVVVGMKTAMYVSMIAFGVAPVLAQNIYLSARNDIPDQLVHKAYTLGASTMEIVVHVVGHQVLPKLIEGVRLLIGPALVYLIAAEMMVGDVGFGYRIRIQGKLSHMDVVYPYIAVLALIGYLLDYGLNWVMVKLCPWYGRSM
jgi:NitT/TauT family transport system permease protein